MALSKEFVAQMQQTLEEQLTEAEVELERLREFMRGEVDVDAEEGDPDLFEREKVSALIAAQERKLESVQRALRAIETGVYGTCERCRAPIDPERLEARPDAVLCIRCQQEVERLARRGLTTPPPRW
ncbi:MAG: TraR/DksA family transcriptional regulator [Anaerolineae bacterium]